jgi:hypothetical protein
LSSRHYQVIAIIIVVIINPISQEEASRSPSTHHDHNGGELG